MAEKTVSVRLKLIHDAYMKAAKEAGTATQNIAKADNFKKLGQETAALGDKLSRNVALPIIGVGVAATKMALDFDAVFVQMQSLAGATSEEIGSMKDSVLKLAGETGKAPKELAEALYFLKSSGLDSAQALEALEVSAKGSAAGLGSTVQVADAVSSAMNAYAEAGLSAAEATDVLVATAREGKVEPAELAAQMGRLLPLSSELGISFQDVGAALAALSLKGGGASQQATTLSGIMTKLLKPSQQGAEALADVGISLNDVRSMIAEKGLLGTLETLRKSLGDTGFTNMIEDTEAIRGALALTGGDVEKNREIFDALNDSVGSTDKAFQTFAESMGAKNAKAWAQMQVALIKLGDVLAPIATDLMSFAASLIDVFDQLPDPLKKAAAALVIAAAAAGPLLSIGGRLVSAWAAFAKVWGAAATWAGGGKAFAAAMNQSGSAAGGVTSKLGGLKTAAIAGGAALGILGAGFALWQGEAAENAAELERLRDALKETEGAIKGVTREIVVDAFEPWIADLNDAGVSVDDLTSALDGNKDAIEKVKNASFEMGAANGGSLRQQLESGTKAINNQRDALKEEAEFTEESTEATKTMVDEHGNVVEVFDEETAAINDAVAALAGYADALKAQFDPLFGLVDAHQGVADARRAVEDATLKLAEAEKEHGRGSAEAAEAARDLVDAQDDAVGAAFDLEGAQINLATAIQDGSVSLDDALGWLQQWVRDGRITQAEADAMAFKFAAVAGEVRTIPRQWNTHLTTTGVEDSIHDIGVLQDRINRLHGRDVGIRIVGTQVGAVLRGGARVMGLGGPVRKNEGYIVGDKGPEWFEPDQNGRIVPNHLLGTVVPQSSFSGSGSGSGGGGVARVVIDVSGGDDQFVRWLRGRVRVEGGGSVQVALGRGSG